VPDLVYKLEKQDRPEQKLPNCTMLSIECINGGGRLSAPRSGVMVVMGLQRGGLFREEWLTGYSDYSKGNSVGSRGVYRDYMLEGEKIYHVMAPESWKRTDDYFCRIVNCEIIRMTIKEVFQWFTSRFR